MRFRSPAPRRAFPPALARLARRVGTATLLAIPAARRAGAQDLQFRHLGVDDGLPSSLVSDIFQDRRGFVWIGTSHGVSRYDGHRFRTYGVERAKTTGLPLAWVDQVYEDHEGTLWVVTAAGLSRYDPARDGFVTYMATPTTLAASRVPTFDTARRLITSVVEDARRTLWVGTSTGLYTFDRRTGTATPYPLPATSNGAQPHVMTVYADRHGRVWVGTRSGLYRLDAVGAAAHVYAHDPTDPTSFPDTVVRTVAEDAAGRVWIGSGYRGLVRFDEATGRFVRYRHDPADPNSLGKDRIVRLASDRARNGLWVGTENGGLDFLDFATGRFRHHRFDAGSANGIGSNSIWSLYVDPNDVLWVGTFSGGIDVSTLNGAAIRHYHTLQGDAHTLSYNAVPAFAEDRRGHVWVATDGGGVNEFDPATGRFERYTLQTTDLNAEAVLGVRVTRSGEVWVATWGGGVSRFDRRTRHFTPYTHANAGLPDDQVYELLEDHRGRLWVGTDNGMIAVLDRARHAFTRRFATTAPGVPASSVLQLRELRDGRFAIGLREGGVTVLDPETGAATHYLPGPRGASGIASPSVRALHEDDRVAGVLWVGSEGGLDRLDLRTGRVRHWGEADGLPSEIVVGIEPDAAGRLWISTDHGVSHFDPRRGTFRTYTRADGVQPGEFLMRASLRAHDGTLYFGGNAGFTTIRPDRLPEHRRRAPVVLTDFQLFNRPVAVGAPGSPLARVIGETRALQLTSAQNVVTFEFAALDFATPGQARYGYRLDGFDAGWQDVGAQHTASYTNLAPGRYTFRVRAASEDGTWDEESAPLALVVTPPAWRTWWFELLAAAGGLGAALWLLRFQQRRRLEVALGRQALRDPLTGLANRTLFRDRVEHALARLARDGVPAGEGARVAVLFLDLDNFKTVNDSLGHHAGDRLLKAAAARLLNATRGCDTVARLGGDEFAVLLENARAGADADVVAGRIADALRAPIAVGDGAGTTGLAAAGAREARIGVSIGIAFAEPGVDADALLRNADAAMYQAKADGKGRHAVFDPALVAAAAERLELENDLMRALGDLAGAGAGEGGQFRLLYQPIVCLATGAVVGAEALVRWHHPARGLISPARFIPLAEASGAIRDLGRWVLDEACNAAAAWPGCDGAPPPGVTVNVSGRQLADPLLPAHVAEALGTSGLPPERLTLEITESVLMHDTAATLGMLRALKTLGVRLAVDDFGTGYSSLRYLQQFPVDVLKIDKSFVDGVAHAPHDAALARTIVALGDMLALRTVAEGVEHAEQREQLVAMGCAYAQGYLFARPLEAAGLRALLEERSGAGV